MLKKLLLGLIVSATTTLCQPKTVINLHGPINRHLVQDFQQIVEENKFETEWVVHFDTPGGSVLDGMKLLPFFETNEVTCVVSRAYSMGFVLLQACTDRQMYKYGTIMAHDMQLSIPNIEFSKLKSYLSFLSRIYDDLLLLQIKRIGISKQNFLKKIRSDWWMNSEQAIQNGCIDKIIL